MGLEWLDPKSESDIRSVLTVFRQSFFDPWPASRLMELLQLPDMHAIIVRVDDLICGCLLYQFDCRVQDICTLGVLADARRLGIGTMLIERAQQMGLVMDITVTAIHESNTPARQCFEKSGFQFAMTVPDYFGKGIDGQLLRWHRPGSSKRPPRRSRKKS